MRTHNVIMLRAGFAPAAVVARELDKALSTIHRLVKAEAGVVGQRDGRALYIDLASLIAYYRSEKNDELARTVSALRDRLVREYGTAPAVPPRAAIAG